jgi:hypothetical protein
MPLDTIQITNLSNALNTQTSSTQTSLPKVGGVANNVTSIYTAENPAPNSPSNVPINASGNATAAATGIKKSNETVSHACDSSSYVGIAIGQVGAFAGKIVQEIRDAIKAIMEYFGVNPSSAGISSQLKKIAQYIKDKTKFIKDIANYINDFITYVNAVKELLAYILSLPAQLLSFFADCVATLKKQLVAGFQSALTDTDTPGDSTLKELQNGIKDVQSSIGQFTTAVASVATTAAAAATSLTTLNTTPTSNAQAQAAATQQVFAAAGFASASGNYSKA